MGRPSLDIRRDMTLTCRVTAEELNKLERWAARAGANVSTFVRAILFDRKARRIDPETASQHSVTEEGITLVKTPRITAFEYFKLIELIRRAGVNLNQLARFANERGVLPPDVERELRTTLAEVRYVVRQARGDQA